MGQLMNIGDIFNELTLFFLVICKYWISGMCQISIFHSQLVECIHEYFLNSLILILKWQIFHGDFEVCKYFPAVQCTDMQFRQLTNPV